VPDSLTLEEFIRGLDRKDRGHARETSNRHLLAQVADSVRRIHDAGFFHHDLVWRNILVTPRGASSWETCWIDCPRGSFVFSKGRRHRSRLRDLASFDKSAARSCHRGDRLRALLRYLKKPRLDDSAKALVRQVLEYRRKRWPEDWP
jgi:tRNA A-37 threonylcarbamoyl transferase component Bud32